MVGRREYAQAKPPNFLRRQEIRKLFAGLTIASASDIRTYALVQLAYTMGLRPKEISRISLDDISFSAQQLKVTERKGTNPVELPMPEHTVKAIAAYVIGSQTRKRAPPRFFNHAASLPAHESQWGGISYHQSDEKGRTEFNGLLVTAHLRPEPA